MIINYVAVALKRIAHFRTKTEARAIYAENTRQKRLLKF